MAITVPPAPTPVGFYDTTPTTIAFRFRSLGDGGSKILEWQIGYGTHPTKVQKTIKSGGFTVVPGLQPATTYYFWARGRNAKGWGPWSIRSSRRTDAGARVKLGTVWREAIPMVKYKGKWRAAEAWVKSGGKWKKAN
jgi:Fibronectin type III domain